jgi:hypothetical protein
MFLAYSPVLAALPAVMFMLYAFCLWFAAFQFAAGVPVVTRRGVVLLLVPTGLFALANLAGSWMGPEVRFAVAGEEWSTGLGYLMSDVLQLVFVAVVAGVFGWLLRSRGDAAFLGKVPSWAVMTAGLVGSVGFVAWLWTDLEFASAATTSVLVVTYALGLMAVASIVSVAVLRFMRSRSADAVLPSTNP